MVSRAHRMVRRLGGRCRVKSPGRSRIPALIGFWTICPLRQLPRRRCCGIMMTMSPLRPVEYLRCTPARGGVSWS